MISCLSAFVWGHNCLEYSFLPISFFLSFRLRGSPSSERCPLAILWCSLSQFLIYEWYKGNIFNCIIYLLTSPFAASWASWWQGLALCSISCAWHRAWYMVVAEIFVEQISEWITISAIKQNREISFLFFILFMAILNWNMVITKYSFIYLGLISQTDLKSKIV